MLLIFTVNIHVYQRRQYSEQIDSFFARIKAEMGNALILIQSIALAPLHVCMFRRRTGYASPITQTTPVDLLWNTLTYTLVVSSFKCHSYLISRANWRLLFFFFCKHIGSSVVMKMFYRSLECHYSMLLLYLSFLFEKWHAMRTNCWWEVGSDSDRHASVSKC